MENIFGNWGISPGILGEYFRGIFPRMKRNKFPGIFKYYLIDFFFQISIFNYFFGQLLVLKCCFCQNLPILFFIRQILILADPAENIGDKYLTAAVGIKIKSDPGINDVFPDINKIDFDFKLNSS